MGEHPTRRAYTPDSRRRVIQAAAEFSRALGDLVERSVVVGGLVPTALEELRVLDGAAEPHLGTLDLDVALAVAIRGSRDAAEVRRRVGVAGFLPATDGIRGQAAWRWVSGGEPVVLLEFLVDSDDARVPPGRVVPVGGDLGALAAQGIRLAFAAPLRWSFPASGTEGSAPPSVRVCGPAAFVVLKSLAVQWRHPRKPKDAYDLHHVLRNCRSRADLAAELAALGDPLTVRDAMEYLLANFGREDARGPRDLERFLAAGDDPGLRADCVGFALGLVAAWERARRT